MVDKKDVKDALKKKPGLGKFALALAAILIVIGLLTVLTGGPG